MTTRTTIRTRPATIFAAKLPTVARIGIPLTLALLVMAAGAGRAHAEAKRLGVLTFKGPAEGATRNVVTKAGKANKFQVVGGQAISKAASKLHVTLDDNDGFKSVAKELGISAFVIGEVTKKKATLTVRNGSDGSVSAEASWTGANPRKLSQAVGKTFWRRLGSAIDRAKSPSGAKQAAVAEEAEAPETGADEPGADDGGTAKSEPKAEKKKVVEAEEAPPAEDEKPRRSNKKKKSSDDEAGSETTVSERAEPGDDEGGSSGEGLVLSIGPRVLSRSLSYSQDIYRRNSKYNLGAAPEFGLNADIYPGALLGASGIASDIGLTVDLSYMLPVVTSPAPNRVGNYKTYALSWSAGAKVRLPAGLFGTIAYGSQRFQLLPSATGTSGVDVPMVDYHYVRIGAGGRFAITPEISLMASAAYLQCLSLGQIGTASYYPKATCGAIEAGAGVGYRLSAMFELQAGASIRRFGLAFHQKRTDFADDPATNGRRIAGGAADQFLMGYVALAVVLGGSGDGGGGHKSEEAAADGDESEAPKKKAKADDDEEGGEAEADAPPPPPKKAKAKKTDDMDL